MVARTLFGVHVGWYELSGGGGSEEWDYDHRKELTLIAACLAAELGLLGAAGWLFVTSR